MSINIIINKEEVPEVPGSLTVNVVSFKWTAILCEGRAQSV